MKRREDTTKDESISPSPTLEEKINHNGFTNNPVFTQVMPPILVVLTIALTFIELNVHFDTVWVLVLVNTFLVIDFGLTICFWYLATSIIPTDGVQLRHLEAIEQGYF